MGGMLEATQSNTFSEVCEKHTFFDPDFSNPTLRDIMIEKYDYYRA